VHRLIEKLTREFAALLGELYNSLTSWLFQAFDDEKDEQSEGEALSKSRRSRRNRSSKVFLKFLRNTKKDGETAPSSKQASLGLPVRSVSRWM
jgi:hypothetical protein